MDESQYLQASEEVMARIEELLDRSDDEIDYERSGVVLTLEFDSGDEMVINKQAPMQEIWVASRLGAHHFRYRDGQWFDTRSDAELLSFVVSDIEQLSGVRLPLN